MEHLVGKLWQDAYLDKRQSRKQVRLFSTYDSRAWYVRKKDKLKECKKVTEYYNLKPRNRSKEKSCISLNTEPSLF